MLLCKVLIHPEILKNALSGYVIDIDFFASIIVFLLTSGVFYTKGAAAALLKTNMYYSEHTIKQGKLMLRLQH